MSTTSKSRRRSTSRPKTCLLSRWETSSTSSTPSPRGGPSKESSQQLSTTGAIKSCQMAAPTEETADTSDSDKKSHHQMRNLLTKPIRQSHQRQGEVPGFRPRMQTKMLLDLASTTLQSSYFQFVSAPTFPETHRLDTHSITISPPRSLHLYFLALFSGSHAILHKRRTTRFLRHSKHRRSDHHHTTHNGFPSGLRQQDQHRAAADEQLLVAGLPPADAHAQRGGHTPHHSRPLGLLL